MLSDPPTHPSFRTDHADLLLACAPNRSGTRLATASSDHRLKVFSLPAPSTADGTWTLTDSWRAHDAEITDVAWNGPFSGQVLGSVGEDGLCKLWSEDVTAPPRSGRRFRCIFTVATTGALPWASLAFRNVGPDTWLALVSRDGALSLLEPKDHDDLAGDWADWTAGGAPLAAGGAARRPDRAEESSFAVRFHPDKTPGPSALRAGVERRSLCLAVVAMDVVRVYRSHGARRLCLAAELTGARALLLDAAWAPCGAVRDYDLLATAGKDGVVRVYELRTPAPDADPPRAPADGDDARATPTAMLSGPRLAPPSGIGAGLAGAQRLHAETAADEDTARRMRFDVALVAELPQHRGPVWRVEFLAQGMSPRVLSSPSSVSLPALYLRNFARFAAPPR